MQKEKQRFFLYKEDCQNFQLLYGVWQKGNDCGSLKEGDIKEVVMT